ncbi:MAG: hypothetical protein K1Y01_09435 [Vicinamibacteria bacterium]|nr:hypothetical protein [Vicinamibacteria bacterium]
MMTTYAGVIPPDLLAEAVKGTMALGREKGTSRFLADCTALEGGHSIVDLYFISQLLEEAGISRTFREAIVLPQLQSAAGEVRFWETTCWNRGMDVRVFKTMAEALAWLGERR